MFNNPYNYNYQANLDRINNQIAELERMKNQISSNPIPQPTNLTQNFQLAPTNNSPMKFPNSILLITMKGHIVCSKNGVVYDTFDCRDREVENVWLVK